MRPLRCLMLVLLSTLGLAVTAQPLYSFPTVPETERESLQTLLNSKTPTNGQHEELVAYIDRKIRAAKRLDESIKLIEVLAEGVKLAPNPEWKHQLSNAQRSRREESSVYRYGGYWSQLSLSFSYGLVGRALDIEEEAWTEATSPAQSIYYQANWLCDKIVANLQVTDRSLEVKSQRRLDERIASIVVNANDVRGQWFMKRANANLARCKSFRANGFGQTSQAMEWALKSEAESVLELRLLLGAPSITSAEDVEDATDDLVFAQVQKVYVFMRMGKLQDAEDAVETIFETLSNYPASVSVWKRAFVAAGDLRFMKREFVVAEQFYRKADAKLGLSLALAGQHKWPQAKEVLYSFKKFARASIAGLNSALNLFLVGGIDGPMVQFGGGDFMGAAISADAFSFNLLNRYDRSSFQVTQALGLSGAGYWRAGDRTNKTSIFVKEAVAAYMLPSNADYLEDEGLRRDIREVTFETYLDIMATSGKEAAIEAMGAADWVRGGVVLQALVDAAARSASSNSALVALVRKEQDAKNHVLSLRKMLEGSGSLDANEVADIRSRLSALESIRGALRSEIKVNFPDYDRLIHPAPPSVSDIAKQLAPDEAVVLVLPTRDGTYVWAVGHDIPTEFVRAQITDAEISALVSKIRRDLDFGQFSNAGETFDFEASYLLYRRLFAPVSKVWKSKAHLIFAAGGSLQRLPISVLLTQPSSRLGPDTPWLVKDVSITNVPSLSGWLALKKFSKNSSASGAMAGWGDPDFAFVKRPNELGLTRSKRNLSLLQSTRDGVSADESKVNTSLGIFKYSSIPTLPDTRDELMAIAGALGADQMTDLRLGRTATRNSVLEANLQGELATKKVLAFATHGLKAGDLPKLSQPALAMAATSPDERDFISPLLTLEDVLTLNLNADWVLLSACNTASDDGTNDEALSGLARAFFYAGSRSVLATQWAVESESASMITTETMKHYSEYPKAPKAESLRQAMLKVMSIQQYQHPAYWAPYALFGDGGR